MSDTKSGFGGGNPWNYIQPRDEEIDGRKAVLGRLPGRNGQTGVNADVHLRQWVDKLFEHITVDDIPYWSGEEVRAAFGNRVDGPQLLEWRGIEMFRGRKK